MFVIAQTCSMRSQKRRRTISYEIYLAISNAGERITLGTATVLVARLLASAAGKSSRIVGLLCLTTDVATFFPSEDVNEGMF